MDIKDKKQVAALLAEREGKRVLLCCDDHQFFPDSRLSMPMQIGCKSCVMAQFFYEFANLPPDVRGERLDAIESVVHHMAEDIERGTFDINLFDRPKFEVIKEDEPKIILTDE